MTSGSTTSTSGAVNQSSEAPEPSYTGRAVRRFEDADLLRGHGRFGDDLPVRPDTLHAAILRSPHAHAEILSVDVAGALAVPGVDCGGWSSDAHSVPRGSRRGHDEHPKPIARTIVAGLGAADQLPFLTLAQPVLHHPLAGNRFRGREAAWLSATTLPSRPP